MVKGRNPGARKRLYREALMAGQGGRCAYCGVPLSLRPIPPGQPPRPDAATLDHRVPRALGGGTRWENLVLACRGCNQAKADAVWPTYYLDIVAASAVTGRA
jgi:5-methylcytosine-specific restriction endonuclease McrA